MDKKKNERGVPVAVLPLVLVPVFAAVVGWCLFGSSIAPTPPRNQELIANLLERLRSNADEFGDRKDLTAPHAAPIDVWTLPSAEDLTTSEDFAAVVISQGKPRLIRNSPVREWPAMHKWSSVSRHFIAEMGAEGPLTLHVSNLPTVRLHSAVQPLGALPDLQWHRPWKEETMTAEQFMALSLNNRRADNRTGERQTKFAYFFSNLNALPAAVQADVGDTSFLTVSWRRVWETNMWMGGPLIRTPTHYDLLHNFYVQVQGHKRFRLYPPSQWPYLYLMPRLHPSTRMSQVDPGTLELLGVNISTAFPDYANLRPYEAVLQPGDVLYLPPYWFHEVTVVGDDVSISISVHTESDEVIRRDLLMQHPIPVQREWPIDLRIKALAYYLHSITDDPAFDLNYTGKENSGGDIGTVAERYQGDGKGNRFIAEVVKNRFSHFGLDPWVEGLAEQIDEAERRWKHTERWELGREEGEDFAICLENDQLARHLEGQAHDLKRKLGRWLATPQGHIEVANVIEDICSYLLGPLDVGPFLRMMATTVVRATC